MVSGSRYSFNVQKKIIMKVALIHDFLLQYGGAERVLEVFSEMFPDAEIFTLCFDSDAFPAKWREKKIHSLMPVLPFIKKYPQLYAAFLVGGMRSISTSEFDLVISSDMIFGKMVSCPPYVKHIVYQYSPANMLYHFLDSSPGKNSLAKLLMSGFQKSFLRREDYLAAQGPDVYLTLSCVVNSRINKYYRRDARVVYPPVALPAKSEVTTAPGEYYLIVSRLVPDKHIEIAVECFSRRKEALIVAGSGDELSRLHLLGAGIVRFINDADDKLRNELYSKCKAVIMCNEEDFGMTAVEAMGYGRGVVAYNKGGAKETVSDGVTGVFFDEPTVESLNTAIDRFEELKIDSYQCRAQAEKFSKAVFENNINNVIDGVTLKRVV